MCTLIGKDNWISKNKEPVNWRGLNVPLVTDPSYPEWSMVLVAPKLEEIDLNQEIDKAIAEGRCQSLKVNDMPYGKFRDIIADIPEEEMPLYAFLIPVILNKGKPSINLVSFNNFSESWAGLGKIGCVSSAIHHRDRSDYLLQGVILSEIIQLGVTEAIRRIKELHKKYNLAGANLLLADKKKIYSVEYLHEKISARRVDDFVIRTNFSPRVGYWSHDWTPESEPFRIHQTVRNLNRQLRANYLMSKDEELSFEKFRSIMSDHGFYPGVRNRIKEIYEIFHEEGAEEALSSLRKIEDNPSYYTICTHPSKAGGEFQRASTIFNFTANLSTREVELTFGNPCLQENVLKITIDDW